MVEESALLEEEGGVSFAASLTCVKRESQPTERRERTLSISILQISAEPAFATGITLISFAS